MAMKVAGSSSSSSSSLRFGHGRPQILLLQHFVTPFLHHLHLRSSSTTSSTSSSVAAHWLAISTDILSRLHDDLLLSYSGAPEDEQTEEMRMAEQLLQALYNHRVTLCQTEPCASVYVKIVQKLWDLEDQGVILRSSLINDLAVRALLETHCIKSCRGLMTLALQSMFITSSQENKAILVDAVLGAACAENEFVNVWTVAIVDGVGKSTWRLNVVELALIDKCKSDDLITNQKTRRLLLCCIKSASSCYSFNSENIRHALCERINCASSKISLSYIRFLQDVSQVDNVDTMVYIKHFIKLLGERKYFDVAVQTAIYNAIDQLKQRSTVNVYKVEMDMSDRPRCRSSRSCLDTS